MHRSATGTHRLPSSDGEEAPTSLSRAEFEALYRQSRSALWCIAAGVLGDRTNAEDVVQEAALIAYSRRETFTPGTSFLAWTSRIVRNVALNIRRKRSEQSMSAIDVAEQTVVDRNHSASNHIPLTANGELKPEQEAFDDKVLTALMQLSSVARAALLLRTVLELSYTEIAETLDIPAGTAMSHVHRSRKLLRSTVLDEQTSELRSQRKP